MEEKILILASASPRRREMLEMLHVPFRILPTGADESHGDLSPRELVKVLAGRKATAATASLTEKEREAAVIVACDTVVELDGRILEKPRDAADAVRMLTALSGSEHFVHSGLALKSADKEIRECVSATVLFRPLTQGEILRYVASGAPLDKAGAYGIQGPAAAFVREVRGDYMTVVGMPLCRLTALLREEFGMDIFLPEAECPPLPRKTRTYISQESL